MFNRLFIRFDPRKLELLSFGDFPDPHQAIHAENHGKAERFIRPGYAEPYNKQLASPHGNLTAKTAISRLGLPQDNLLSSTIKA
jgi:hypothetical protein